MPSVSAILIIWFVATFVAGLGGGATLMHWRDSGKITRLDFDNSVLKSVNEKCASDIAAATAAVKAMTEVAQERERSAAEAMQRAQPEVQAHTARVIRIRQLPAVKPDEQCVVLVREQLEYVQERRAQ